MREARLRGIAAAKNAPATDASNEAANREEEKDAEVIDSSSLAQPVIARAFVEEEKKGEELPPLPRFITGVEPKAEPITE